MIFEGNECFDVSVNAEVEYFAEHFTENTVETYASFFLYLVKSEIKNEAKKDNPLHYFVAICRSDYDFDIVPETCEADYWNTVKAAYRISVTDKEKSDEAKTEFKKTYGKVITKAISQYVVNDNELYEDVKDFFSRRNILEKFESFMSEQNLDIPQSQDSKRRRIDPVNDNNASNFVEMNVSGKTQEVGVGRSVNVPSSSPSGISARRAKSPSPSPSPSDLSTNLVGNDGVSVGKR